MLMMTLYTISNARCLEDLKMFNLSHYFVSLLIVVRFCGSCYHFVLNCNRFVSLCSCSESLSTCRRFKTYCYRLMSICSFVCLHLLTFCIPLSKNV